jgi:hypothetical protein
MLVFSVKNHCNDSLQKIQINTYNLVKQSLIITRTENFRKAIFFLKSNQPIHTTTNKRMKKVYKVLFSY